MGWGVTISLLGVLIASVLSQENAGNNIAGGLIVCYNETAYPGITDPENLIPTSATTLISIIRKIEDAYPDQDAQKLIIQLLQRFRQDGIVKSKKSIGFGIPYGIFRLENFKNAVFLKYLIPDSKDSFRNDSITTLELCSLHRMISSTVRTETRGDEDRVCGASARYTARITKRSIKHRDIENLDKTQSAYNKSECPIELGVVQTPWGAVKAGNVLNGIATGLNYEKVTYCNNCDNEFAGTLGGELAEHSIWASREIPEMGSSGGWNSNINPRNLYLSKNDQLQLVTDAELRGSLDGLFMALKMDDWKVTFPDIKISQILDLYYSPRGVFNSALRACNRFLLLTDIFTSEQLKSEVTKFAPLLYNNTRYAITIDANSFGGLVNTSVDSFYNYIVKLSDVVCTKNETVERVATNITIFVDLSWPYDVIQPTISYILNNIDVSKFETSYTVVNAKNNAVIVNNTNHITRFYEHYNRTRYNNTNDGGFDYNQVIASIEDICKDTLNNNTNKGGQSNIILLMPNKVPTSDEGTFFNHRRSNFIDNIPDFTIMVVGSGSTSDYNDIVSSTSSGSVQILSTSTDENTIKDVASKVVEKIRKIPRSVINPNCGSNFTESSSSTVTLEQFVEPQGVNRYRVSPAYFYSGADNRQLKIKGYDYGSIRVCQDQNNEPTSQSGTCNILKANETTVDIKSLCSDSFGSCEPIYLTIEGLSSDVKCRDTLCRFPDSVKYTITLENVGCSSDATRILGNFVIVTIFLYLLSF